MVLDEYWIIKNVVNGSIFAKYAIYKNAVIIADRLNRENNKKLFIVEYVKN